MTMAVTAAAAVACRRPAEEPRRESAAGTVAPSIGGTSRWLCRRVFGNGTNRGRVFGNETDHS